MVEVKQVEVRINNQLTTRCTTTSKCTQWTEKDVRKDTAFSQLDQHPSTERCKLYHLYLPYQRHPRCHSCLSCRLRFPSCGWQSESFGPTSVCTVQCMWRGVLHWTVHRWRSWTYVQTPSKWFLCWSCGWIDCRHSLWVSWGSSLQT